MAKIEALIIDADIVTASSKYEGSRKLGSLGGEFSHLNSQRNLA